MDGGYERVLRNVKHINTTATDLDFTMCTECLINFFKCIIYYLHLYAIIFEIKTTQSFIR